MAQDLTNCAKRNGWVQYSQFSDNGTYTEREPIPCSDARCII